MKLKIGIAIFLVVLLLSLGGYLWLTRDNDDDYDRDDKVSVTLDKAEIASAIALVKDYPLFQTFAGENIKYFTFRAKNKSPKGEIAIDATRWAGQVGFVYRFYVLPTQGHCRAAYELFPQDRAFLLAFHSPTLQQFVQNKVDRLIFKMVMPPDKENPSTFIISIIEVLKNGSLVTDELSVDIQTEQVEEVDI